MLRVIAFLISVACLVGCRSAPVQEMSDARQAIAAARVAGATDSTSTDFHAAQVSIARAETHLQAQEYTRARIAALEAKRHAAAALTKAQRNETVPATPPPPAAPASPPR